jgi:hypothetical protein
MKSQCANDELSQQKGSIKEKLPGVPIRFVSTEGFTPERCAISEPSASSRYELKRAFSIPRHKCFCAV